jgi:sterol desaturase/sphingolipid hydroxylase (fatty acid hydroxylase superfamily)
MSGLTALFGEATPVSSVALATLVTTVLAILAADFGLWLGHWLLHRIPVLWEFHKVHHSAEVLTPFTAGRVHPLEDLINMWLSGLCGGFVFGLCQYAFGPSATMITVFQLNVIMFLFYVFGFHLRHSHVWVAYKGVWGKLFVSPAHHQLHHSIATRHWDKNMGFVFAIWDWAFGTLFVPERREKIVFGMNGWEEKEFHSVKAMYLLPFVKAWRLIRGRADAPAQQSTLPSE